MNSISILYFPISLFLCLCYSCFLEHLTSANMENSYLSYKELKWKVKVLVTQSCLTLCYPTTAASVHRILQGRILEWVAIPFSRGSFWARGWSWVYYIADRFFIFWDTREVKVSSNPSKAFFTPSRMILHSWMNLYPLFSSIKMNKWINEVMPRHAFFLINHSECAMALNCLVSDSYI